MDYFTSAFAATVRVLLTFAGGAAAVLLALLAVGIAAGLVAWMFDLVTSAMARRWRRKGRKPRGRIGRVIYGRDV